MATGLEAPKLPSSEAPKDAAGLTTAQAWLLAIHACTLPVHLSRLLVCLSAVCDFSGGRLPARPLRASVEQLFEGL